MTDTVRTPGKFGRLPALIPAGLREFSYYSAGPLPKPPASVAVPEVAAWDMDGNDVYGDCGVAGLNHGLMAAAADTGLRETFPSAEEIVQYYMTYTGGQDSGVILSQFLAYARQTGFLGHTVSAYAPVSVSDVPTLQFAISAYDFAYTGIRCSQAMLDAFNAGEPWTLDVVLAEPEGGHAIPLVGYDSSWLYCVTWGQVQEIAYSAWHHIADEAWAVLAGELVTAKGDGHGINLAALQADLNRLSR